MQIFWTLFAKNTHQEIRPHCSLLLCNLYYNLHSTFVYIVESKMDKKDQLFVVNEVCLFNWNNVPCVIKSTFLKSLQTVHHHICITCSCNLFKFANLQSVQRNKSQNNLQTEKHQSSLDLVRGRSSHFKERWGLLTQVKEDVSTTCLQSNA